MLIRTVKFNWVWNQWMPDDAEFESLECNLYLRTFFQPIPDNAKSFIVNLHGDMGMFPPDPTWTKIETSGGTWVVITRQSDNKTLRGSVRRCWIRAFDERPVVYIEVVPVVAPAIPVPDVFGFPTL